MTKRQITDEPDYPSPLSSDSAVFDDLRTLEEAIICRHDVAPLDWFAVAGGTSVDLVY